MDGLVNGKHAETTTIPRPVREDKRRSESEPRVRWCQHQGSSQRPTERQVMTAAPTSGCTAGTRWLIPRLGEVETAPGRLCMSLKWAFCQKKNSISSPDCAGPSSSCRHFQPHFGGNWIILFICLYTFMFIKGLNFKYLHGCLFHFNLFISSIFLI